ncbi:MAG TPA: hypothetical protein VMX13_16580 [Sedimentisphaerales bacterium]|nr:hypothetical protein [Sedimentisphaerales bacterium]
MDAEQFLIVLLVVVNVAMGLGFAAPIARLLGRISGKSASLVRYVIMLVAVYFAECVAFSAGMATQVFSIGLAFVWGAVLGLWLRRRAPANKVLKAAVYWALYGSLPTVSFCILVLFSFVIAGESILSSEAGVEFGIPDLVPWPLNTILGFCAALGIGTAVLKTAITTGEVRLLIHLAEKSARDGSSRADKNLSIDLTK